MLQKLFDRLDYYFEIHQNADAFQIANLAYEEWVVSFLEILKFDGEEFIKQKILENNKPKLSKRLLIVMNVVDSDFAMENYKKFLDAKDPLYLVDEPLGWQNMNDQEFKQSTTKFLEDIRIRRLSND